MEQDFIQNHWKGKLIKNNFDRSFTNEVKLSQETRSFLENIGLPVILPIEEKTSFLPFTCFPQKNIQDKDFYIIGDFSPNLTGSVLLGLEIGSERVYRINKNYENITNYYFINQSLQQFLMCLAYLETFQEEEDKRITEKYIQTLEEMKATYQNLRNNINNIDKEAVSDKYSYWGHIIEDMRTNIMVAEMEENAEKIPDNPNIENFPDISREDLPF